MTWDNWAPTRQQRQNSFTLKTVLYSVTALAGAFVFSSCEVDATSSSTSSNVLTASIATVPSQVSGVTSGATAVRAGGGFTCAIVSDKVNCWGSASSGQLGDGNSGSSGHPIPVEVTNLEAGIVDLSAGIAHACAAAAGNDVKCWGYDVAGQLGTGDYTAAATSPVAVSVVTDSFTFEDIEAGGDATCMAVEVSGEKRVYCWGYAYHGRLGDEVTEACPSGSEANQVCSATAVRVLGLPTSWSSIKLEMSQNATFALIDGTVWAWGSSASGELASGFYDSSTNNNDGIPIGARGRFVANPIIALGGSVTHVGANNGLGGCAIIDNTTVKCWGDNTYGALGNQIQSSSVSLPVTVTGLPSTATPIKVSTNGSHACVAMSDGTAWCWGKGDTGALGNNSTSHTNVPSQVSGLTGVTDIEVGGYHTCAVDGGALKCWGTDYQGRLGDG